MTLTDAARAAGFSLKQIEFIKEYLAPVGHEHVAEEIKGLEETVAELVEANMDEEEGEDE